MEGPCLRAYPRTSFACPVEVRDERGRVRVRADRGDVSIRGLCLKADGVAINTPVRVKISCSRPLELDGIVRYCNGNGLGIEFKPLSKAKRQRVCDLIAEFMPKEVLAA